MHPYYLVNWKKNQKKLIDYKFETQYLIYQLVKISQAIGISETPNIKCLSSALK